MGMAIWLVEHSLNGIACLCHQKPISQFIKWSAGSNIIAYSIFNFQGSVTYNNALGPANEVNALHVTIDGLNKRRPDGKLVVKTAHHGQPRNIKQCFFTQG